MLTLFLDRLFLVYFFAWAMAFLLPPTHLHAEVDLAELYNQVYGQGLRLDRRRAQVFDYLANPRNKRPTGQADQVGPVSAPTCTNQADPSKQVVLSDNQVWGRQGNPEVIAGLIRPSTRQLTKALRRTSRIHFVVKYIEGHWYMVETSLNGTQIDDRSQAAYKIHASQSRRIRDGMSFTFAGQQFNCRWY